MKIGLLPLYIALYDTAAPGMRPGVEAFYEDIRKELTARGFDVLTAPVCRLEPEFRDALTAFENGGAEALVTLHLAYSPSLESAQLLKDTVLPIFVLDTTPDETFGFDTPESTIDCNHGIHGVQDMCSMFVRNKVPFRIYAGCYKCSDVVDRLAEGLKACAMAAALKRSRIGLVGGAFKGMGDFQIPADEMQEKLGITTVVYDEQDDKWVQAVTQAEIDAEVAADKANYNLLPGALEVCAESEKTALAIRKWIEAEKLTGFTMNFLGAGTPGFITMPFSEACKQMEKGIGYAGEGDVMTAALVGALLTAYPETTFAEMFCPDWTGNRVFFSHMGEFNLRCSAYTPNLIRKDFIYAPAPDPVSLAGVFKAGSAVFVDLAPGPDGTFNFIIAPGHMEQPPEKRERFNTTVAGWYVPPMPTAPFLEAYSRAGGTHHGALVYGGCAETLAAFGKLMGWNVTIIA